MPTYRIVWEYTENNGAGFNEVYYKDAADIASALKVDENLIGSRLFMMHPLNTLLRIRVSDTTALRKTGTQPLKLTGNYGGDSGPVAVGDAAVFALSSAAGGTRKLWMRGCPDSYIQRDPKTGIDAPPAFFQKLQFTWFTALEASGYGIRRLTPSAPGPLQKAKILSVDGTAKDGTSKLTFANAPGYPVPSQIVIGNASKKDLPGLNGTYSVLAVNGAIVTIPYQTPLGALIVTSTATARQAVYQATAVFSAALCAFDHNGTRTSRNPLSRSRGARRAARLRLSL